MSTAPVLDGIHHLKLPVTDLDRSLAWYQEHLGYAVMTEFVEEGVRMGVAMTHPNGGPDLALALRSRPSARRGGLRLLLHRRARPRRPSKRSPPTSRRGACTTTACTAHPWAGSCSGCRIPTDTTVRFYTVPLELPDEAFLAAYEGENRAHR